MRLFRFHVSFLALTLALGCYLTLASTEQPLSAQETTGGLQGTVKDASGAVVPRARVTLTGTNMIGSKELITDSSGFYHFANLPPGTYILTVRADGFKAEKRAGLSIEVGRIPSVDIALQVGAEATTVEVTSSGPVIDTTTTQNITNVSTQQLQNLPTGTTFQSVIQFAPMARDEPLAGMQTNGHGTGGSGGSMPGSSGNGLSLGYSIGGAADSESSYLVEGQDTENISGGYSKANVPMEFIQDVDIKTSGVEAEYGGALGGVVNVILKKGSDAFHGQISSTYESSGTDANPVNAYLRYDPTSLGTGRFDPAAQTYSPQKVHFRTAEPSILVGGPIVKEHLWFVAGFEPLISSKAETVNFGSNDNNAGNQYFTQDRQQYFGYGRIDAALTQKIRVFGSWLTQYARETGDEFPIADPTATESAALNTAILSPLSQYNHGLGWSAPNATYNVGADISLTQKLVATTRYGYFFDNYHDFGWPTQTPDIVWNNNGSGACDNGPAAASAACPHGGSPLPDSIQNYNGSPANGGTSTTPYDSTYTVQNADKHYQLNQDFAFYKGGWWGTHNFKFGYQLNHLVNVIDQNGNVPYAFMEFGRGVGHGPLTSTGGANCAELEAEYQYVDPVTGKTVKPCVGLYGTITVQDFSTILLNSSGKPTPASDWNHALYVQDSWNIGHGLTLDLGLRIEKETLPAPGGVKVSSISFPWSDKVEPRLGAAWDPTGRGKMKIYGSYGVVNDVMKLLLAQTSWGAQAYEQCSYPIGPDGTPGDFSVSDINLQFKAGRACPNGPATTQANFTGSGSPPATLTDTATGVSIIENVNFRPWEPVSPGVKPYRQHEYVAGFEYQISQALAFSARYNRRRLDHVIEDASLSDVNWGETYTIVNPGENVNDTIDHYATYLGSLGQAFGVPGWAFDPVAFGTCASCPANPKAIRDYDGLELRLTMAPSHGFSGMFSYTYSSLWGNYTGLTTTDQSDGGVTGRNSPDTTRAFDEPFFYFGANGKSTNGHLPTDRPNVIKGLGYYTLPWKHQTTTIGLVENFLQGTPVGSYIDIGGATTGQDFEGTYPFGRDQWVNATQDATGNITLGTPYLRRTPWFTQSDLSVSHDIKVGDHEDISFEANALNVLNQRAVVAYFEGMDSWQAETSLSPTNAGCGGPCNIYSGASFYEATETGYNVQSLINPDGVVLNSQYGQPYLYQTGRQLRLGLRYTF
jgi:outer membrane receptor protein involved in Fe transport